MLWAERLIDAAYKPIFVAARVSNGGHAGGLTRRDVGGTLIGDEGSGGWIQLGAADGAADVVGGVEEAMGIGIGENAERTGGTGVAGCDERRPCRS